MQFLHQNKKVHELRRSGNLDYPVHLHNALEFVYLRKGSCRVQCDGSWYMLSPGQLFVSFPNRLHCYEGSRDIDAFIWIIPVQPFLGSYQSVFESMLPQSPVIDVQGSLPQLLGMALEERDQASLQVMLGYIQLIVGKVLEQLSLEPARTGNADALQSVLLYLNDHYREPLTRQEIAAAVGYNVSYISHIFSDALHTTLTDYLTNLRLAEATQLLQSTRIPVGRIALDLGFGSIRSFNRIFSQKAGISPRDFRKQGPIHKK